MPHQSDDCQRLKESTKPVATIHDLESVAGRGPEVYLLHFPLGRTDLDASNSGIAFQRLSSWCSGLHDESTVCIFTTPADAARLMPFLETALKFQLWVAVKLPAEGYETDEASLPQRHAALLVFTRYRGSLRHTTTRIQYSYCPACGKTTKDYGGKKHIYHPYGTLMSDVWRDLSCDPHSGLPEVVERLRDVFGLEPYEKLRTLDMRRCKELFPATSSSVLNEDGLQLAWGKESLPLDSKLLNDDCLTALRSLPDSSVDFCFADPPYNIKKKYDHWNDALEAKHYFEWCDSWLSELARVLKPGRTLTVVNIPLWAVRHYQHLCKTMRFQNWLAWDGLSLPVRMIMPSHYTILCFSKGEPRPLPGLSKSFLKSVEGRQALPMTEFFCIRSSCLDKRRQSGFNDRAEFSDLWSDIHRLKHNSRRVDHPCQLPPVLMRRLFSLFTLPGETVVDCFDGAGTSTLVAHQMKRRFIGIELSPKYHALAAERHEQITHGVDPFGKQDEVPKAKNSRVERLPKQKYEVSKKVLQLEVRQIATRLKHLPSREEVARLSKYPIEYFDKYFLSWGEVCAAARHAGMSETNPDADAAQPLLL